jgi:hypothetical protein
VAGLAVCMCFSSNGGVDGEHPLLVAFGEQSNPGRTETQRHKQPERRRWEKRRASRRQVKVVERGAGDRIEK